MGAFHFLDLFFFFNNFFLLNFTPLPINNFNLSITLETAPVLKLFANKLQVFAVHLLGHTDEDILDIIKAQTLPYSPNYLKLWSEYDPLTLDIEILKQ